MWGNAFLSEKEKNLTKTLKKIKNRERLIQYCLQNYIWDSLLSCTKEEILLAPFARIIQSRWSQTFQNKGKHFNKSDADIPKERAIRKILKII